MIFTNVGERFRGKKFSGIGWGTGSAEIINYTIKPCALKLSITSPRISAFVEDTE